MAGALWLSALGLVIFAPSSELVTQVVLLAVSAAAALGVIAGIGTLLAKGSAEKVYELGYDAGYKAASAELYDWPPQDRAKVAHLSAYRG